MRMIAKYKPLELGGGSSISVDSGIPPNINLVGCDTGAVATYRSALRLCLACANLAGHKPAIDDGAPPYPLYDCNLLSSGAATTFHCATTGGPAEVLRLKVDNNVTDTPPSLKVNPSTISTNLVGLTSTTNAGNEVSSDLEPNLIIQVTPGPNPGPVTVTVDFAAGGSSPSGSITTFGKSQQTIHQDLANLLSNPPFGYTGVQVIAPDDPPDVFQTPGMFTDGPFVFVPNIGTLNGNAVRDVRIKGGIGDLLEVENSELPSSNVPAMSAWSIAVLVALLMLSGAWLMRRQRVASAH